LSRTYVHFPGCRRAFDVSRSTSCRHCGRGLATAGRRELAELATTFEERVLAGAEQLGRALAEATSAERAGLAAALDARLAGPLADSASGRWRESTLAAVRAALAHGDSPKRAPLLAAADSLVAPAAGVSAGDRHAAGVSVLVLALLARLARPAVGAARRTTTGRRAVGLARRVLRALG
jgi:hypothetical protein